MERPNLKPHECPGSFPDKGADFLWTRCSFRIPIEAQLVFW